MNENYSVYFDRYQRFRAAAEIIDSMPGAGNGFRMLDAGGFDDAFREFVAKHELIPHNEHISPENGPASYANEAFDICVALDVLEHVPPKNRLFFLSELTRISRVGLVVGFPVAAAQEAERFVLRLTGSAWLAEHQQYGLPEPKEVEALFTQLGLRFTVTPNACLPSWTAMMLLMHGTDKPTRLTISEFFNRCFFCIENREPAYRYIYTCLKG